MGVKTLFVMRHGDASFGGPDHARPLTSRGSDEVMASAGHLTGIGWIAASPLLRARQSAGEVMGGDACRVEIWPELIPGGTPGGVYGKLQSTAGNGLLVSHLPLVAVLIEDLTGVVPQMTTGTVAKVSGKELLPGWCALDWVKQP